MKTKETQHHSSDFLNSAFGMAMLLTVSIQVPGADAGEETVGFQDTLQSAMMRNQAFVDQRLSGLQDDLIHKSYSRVSALIENETKEKMRDIELANESTIMLYKGVAEATKIVLPPTGITINTLEGVADNNTRGY